LGEDCSNPKRTCHSLVMVGLITSDDCAELLSLARSCSPFAVLKLLRRSVTYQPKMSIERGVAKIMAPDRQHEVDDLSKQAQKILLHELTEDEHSLVSQLAFDNHPALSDEKLARLRNLVKKKGHLRSATS